MSFRDLSGDQARQTIDVEQVFSAYAAARSELDRRYAGSMSWKAVGGRRYLYRKRHGAWKSLGAESPETLAAHREYHQGREGLKDRIAGLTQRLDEMAPVNRALQIARLPVIAARVLRALSDAGLIGNLIDVVGTNALFAYERLAGVQIAGAQLATGDIDLLFDARAASGSSPRALPPRACSGNSRKSIDRSLRWGSRAFEPSTATATWSI